MISTIEKVLFLKGVDLFRSIPGEELSHIARITTEVEFEPTKPVVREGEPGDSMYLIVDGQAQVHSGDRHFAQLGPNECFGEMAILDAEPRSATVTPITELRVLHITQSDFSDILMEKPEISHGIIKTLTQRLREANKR